MYATGLYIGFTLMPILTYYIHKLLYTVNSLSSMLANGVWQLQEFACCMRETVT
jgi:predicted Na+-dependent transporter